MRCPNILNRYDEIPHCKLNGRICVEELDEQCSIHDEMEKEVNIEVYDRIGWRNR